MADYLVAVVYTQVITDDSKEGAESIAESMILDSFEIDSGGTSLHPDYQIASMKIKE